MTLDANFGFEYNNDKIMIKRLGETIIKIDLFHGYIDIKEYSNGKKIINFSHSQVDWSQKDITQNYTIVIPAKPI